MTHFSEASWTDFARNLVAPDTKMAMQSHLDDGCKKCADTLQMWQGVHSIATAESVFTPPSDVVRVVNSQFAPEPEKSQRFRLLFDSRLEPVPAGIRGSVAAQQFLYETDEYFIDLRVEPHRDAHPAAVVGQVLNRTGKDRATQGLAVLLQDGKRSIAETLTNQFGEFQLEFDDAKSLSVSVCRSKSDAIVLPLYGIDAKSNEKKRGK